MNSIWRHAHIGHVARFSLFPAVLLFCDKYAACISQSVNQPVVQSLIVSLVISRLYYGSAMLAGLPACLDIDRTRQTSVCREHCGLSDLKIQEIRPRDVAAAQPSLSANPGTNHVSAGGFGVPLSKWTCTTVPCWWPSPGGRGWITATTAFGGDCVTDRPSHGAFYTIGDRAFSVAAAVAWNILPLSVSSSASLPVSGSIWRQFYSLAPSRESRRSLRVFLLCLLVYSGFMYRGLITLRHVNLIYICITWQKSLFGNTQPFIFSGSIN